MLKDIVLAASNVPIYVQLQEQFLTAIGSGRLKPGEQLPTVRAVATTLGINPNTVQQAYAELEKCGAIVVQRGRGTFVADKPPPIDPALRRAKLDDFVHRLIAGARTQGFSLTEILTRIREIDPEL